MAQLIKWSFDRVVRTIVATILNKFDCFIILEGNRGLGKSTLAFHLAKAVSNEMKRMYRYEPQTILYYYEMVKREKDITLDEFVYEIAELKKQKAYHFNPKLCLLYTREEVMLLLHQWKKTGIADEMINVTFNRDFYSEDQKDLIKMINMNRDHSNLLIACVPRFQTLDSQIKDLCKIKLTVVRRGLAVVQTPNRTIYSKDKWDQATNEKIEKEWLKKGIQNPHYSKLTTFRGIMRFPPLTRKQEGIYQQIKNDKRNIIAKEMGVEKKIVIDPVDKIVQMLEEGKIRNSQIIDGMALNLDKDPNGFKRVISNRLKKMGKMDRLSEYYWDNKEKKKKTKEQIAEWRDVFNE